MILESSDQYFPFCRSTNMHRFKRRFKKIFSAFLFLYVWRKSLLWINSVIHAIRESENKKRKIDSTHSSEVWSSKREKFLMNPWENGRENELERKWKRRGGKKWKSMVFLSFLSFLRDRSQWLTLWLTTLPSFPRWLIIRSTRPRSWLYKYFPCTSFSLTVTLLLSLFKIAFLK